MGTSQGTAVVAEIEAMADRLGRGLYRGPLRDLARVWNPREIDDVSRQQRVLENMRSAERGLKRLEAALDKTGAEALIPVLNALVRAQFNRASGQSRNAEANCAQVGARCEK
jgi:hypothetical protein